MDMAVSRYSKPFTSVPEQVRRLQHRGLQVDDLDEAESVLRRCGYYRLSGYTHFFRQPNAMRRFAPGTNLRQVVDLYQFDEVLRSVVLDGIAQLEPALRFHVGHRLGRSAVFAHRLSMALNENQTLWRQGPQGVKRSNHSEWLAEYSAQERRSQETFVQHFRTKYGPHLPVWVATEVMTLGTLTRLFDLMPDNDRKLVALRFGLLMSDGDGDPGALSNWLNLLRHTRNICAHHSRLWNRTLDVSLTLPSSTAAPELSHIPDTGRRRLYGVLAALRYLLARVAPESRWYAGALATITDFARTSGIPLARMGFPFGWQSEKLWAPKYSADALLRDVIDAIDAIDSVNRPGAMQLLSSRAGEAAQKKWLRSLIKNRALIIHQAGPQQHFPAFQFISGDIHPRVGDANEHLFSRIDRTAVTRAHANLRAQRWWITPDPVNGFDMQPLDLLSIAPQVVVDASARWASGALAHRDARSDDTRPARDSALRGRAVE